MKNKKLLLLLTLLFAQFSFAQLGSREIIKGQIISEATAIDNVTVFNISLCRDVFSSDGFDESTMPI